MHIDPRLSEIDDSLYRVAVRALIVQDHKVLLVKEVDVDDWWAIPGGGISYGETLELSLFREIEEELGVPAESVSYEPKVALYDIGKEVHGIPRMNLFFKVSIPRDQIKKTANVEKWAWLTKSEFLELNLNLSYDKTKLVDIIFG